MEYHTVIICPYCQERQDLSPKVARTVILFSMRGAPHDRVLCPNCEHLILVDYNVRFEAIIDLKDPEG